MGRFDGAVNCPEIHSSHTHANSCIWSSIYNLFSITYSYHHVADLKLFNRSHKSKKTRPNSVAPPSHRESFKQRNSRFSDSSSMFLCCHLVEIKDVITPRKITFFNCKSWTKQRIRCRQKGRCLEDFSFRGKTKINSKRGEQLRQSNSGGEIGRFYSRFAHKF